LCDEPTGSLDHATGASILSLFESLHRDQGFTLIMVTHEERATAIAHRVIRLENGRVAEDRTREAA
jgi:putative ABC transport system ATP-binding protein